jgi:hypothetical protein
MTTLTEEDKNQKLNSLKKYKLLNTAPENSFADLASLAATVCRTSTAFVALIDSVNNGISNQA